MTVDIWENWLLKGIIIMANDRASQALCVCSVTSVVSESLQPHGPEPARVLYPWDSPGKNTGVGCHALLQGIFPTEGSNPGLLHLLHCRPILYPLSHLGSPN